MGRGDIGGNDGDNGDVGDTGDKGCGWHSQRLVGLDVGSQADAQGPAVLPHALSVATRRGEVDGQCWGGQRVQAGTQPHGHSSGDTF